MRVREEIFHGAVRDLCWREMVGDGFLSVSFGSGVVFSGGSLPVVRAGSAEAVFLLEVLVVVLPGWRGAVRGCPFGRSVGVEMAW